MNRSGIRRILMLIGCFFLIWGVIRYLLPLIYPFLLGWIFAAMAEPLNTLLRDRLRLHRALSAGISVSLVLALLFGLVWTVAALGYRELTALAAGIPEHAQELNQRFAQLREWALGLVSRAPEGIADTLRQGVTGLFTGGGVILERLATGIIGIAGNMAGKLPGGALTAGTAVLSAYLISAQYPSLKRRLTDNEFYRRRWEPLLDSLRGTAGLWLKAQVRLTGVTFAIASAGFLILRVEHWLLWAIITAVVDAIPMLGTGTILIPMAFFSLLWGEQVRGIGLIGLYVTAMLTRSALEPKLVGNQLGLNPLLTLIALYVGFQIWGVPGMILSPILAVTVFRLTARRD